MIRKLWKRGELGDGTLVECGDIDDKNQEKFGNVETGKSESEEILKQGDSGIGKFGNRLNV